MARYRKGESGNPTGRPKGILDWRGKIRQQIQGAMPEIIDKLIEQALAGDSSAAKILADKCLPSVKPASLPVDLGIPSDAGLLERAMAVINATGQGLLCPDTATGILTALGACVKIREYEELRERIAALECGEQRLLIHD